MASSVTISPTLIQLSNPFPKSNPFPSQVIRKRKYEGEPAEKSHPIEKRVQRTAIDSLLHLQDPICTSRPLYQLSSRTQISEKRVVPEDQTKKTGRPQSISLNRTEKGMLPSEPGVTVSPKDHVCYPGSLLRFKLSSPTESMNPLQIEAIKLFNTDTPLPLKELGHRVRLFSLKVANAAIDSEDMALASKALCLDMTALEKANLFKTWGYISLKSALSGNLTAFDSTISYFKQALALNALPAEIASGVHNDLGNAYMKRGQEGDIELARSAYFSALKAINEPQKLGNLLIECGIFMKSSDKSNSSS